MPKGHLKLLLLMLVLNLVVWFSIGRLGIHGSMQDLLAMAILAFPDSYFAYKWTKSNGPTDMDTHVKWLGGQRRSRTGFSSHPI